MENSKSINFGIYAVMVIPFLYLAYVWNSLPDEVAIHYNIHGEADGFGSKNLLFYLPLLMIGTTFLLFKIIPKIDPKKRIEQMGNSYDKLQFLLVGLMSAISLFLIYTPASGGQSANNILFAILGIFFMALGNYLPTVKPNYFIGIRTPWALESESNWHKTHRLAGKTMMIGGLIITIGCLAFNSENAFFLMMTVSFFMVIIPFVFSYLEYRKM